MASEYDSLLEEPPKQSEYDALLAPTQEKPSVAALAGRTAWDVVKQVTGLHQPTSLSEVAQEIFPTKFENTLVGGMLGGAKRTFEQYASAAQTPDFSPEKFAFAGNVVGQAGGQLLGLLGLKAEPAITKTAPTLAETAGIAKPEIAPETVTPEPITPVATDAATTETATQPGQFTTNVEATADQSARNLEGQFADLQAQSADLQARINAQRAAAPEPQPVPEAPVSTTGSGIQETAAPLSTETVTPEEVTSNAQQISEPTQIHGDVLNVEGTQAGVREVPTDVSSEGVQTRGQGTQVQGGKEFALEQNRPEPEVSTFSVEMPKDVFGSEHTPVSSFLIDNVGGVVSKSAASKAGKLKANPDLWDDAQNLSHPTHNKVYNTNGELPDTAAQALYDAGLISDPSPTTMWKAIGDESKSARSVLKSQQGGVKDIQQQAGQAKDFGTDQKKAWKSGEPLVQVRDLQVGDTVTVKGESLKVTDIDPDNFDVTLEDGKKYGVQTVKDNTVIYGQHETTLPAPKLLAGETQGDLISSTQKEDFALVGEKGTDFGAQQAAVEKARAERAQSEKGQLELGENVAPQSFSVPNSENLHPEPNRARLRQLADDDPGVINATVKTLDTNPQTRALRDALVDGGSVKRRGNRIFILDKRGKAIGQVDPATGGLSVFENVPIERFEKQETHETGMPQYEEKIDKYAGLTTKPPLVSAHGPRFEGDTYAIINGHHRYEAALRIGSKTLRTDASVVDQSGTWISIPKAGQESGIPNYEARLKNAIEELRKPPPVPSAPEATTAAPLPKEEAAPKTEAVTPPETPSSTGVHAAALEERPINAPPPGEVTGWEANTEQGHDWLDKGGDPQTIINKFADTKAVTPEDMGRMRAALQRLQAGTDAAGDALRKDPGNPELETAYQTANDAEQRFTDAFKPMHTFASANLASLQGKVPFDEGAAKSFTGMHREFQANMGREFKPEEAIKADKLVEKNTEAGQKFKAANDELFKTVDKEFEKVPSKIRGRAPTLKELGDMFSEKLREVCDV